jgi:hypothetical protein
MKSLMSGVKTSGAAILLALLLAHPARAQLDQSSPVHPGTVAIKVANLTGCPMAIRAKVNGVTRYVGALDSNTVRRIDARPDTNALEVEILASPKLCGLAIPEQREPSPPASTPVAPLRPLQRARYQPLRRIPVHSPFAVRRDA